MYSKQFGYIFFLFFNFCCKKRVYLLIYKDKYEQEVKQEIIKFNYIM